MYENYLGKKVLVRSVEAGVYFGTLEEVEGKTMRLSKVRNLWHWTGANTLLEIAVNGITGDKISIECDSVVITDVCECVPVNSKAAENIKNQPVWKY